MTRKAVLISDYDILKQIAGHGNHGQRFHRLLVEFERSGLINSTSTLTQKLSKFTALGFVTIKIRDGRYYKITPSGKNFLSLAKPLVENLPSITIIAGQKA